MNIIIINYIIRGRKNNTCACYILYLKPKKHKTKCNRSSFVIVSTCYGVESSDHQHEDSGQVQVPSQAHLDKQGSRVQVSLAEQTKDIFNAGTQSSCWTFCCVISSCSVVVTLFLPYRYLGEDRQQEWEDSEVRSDPFPSKTTPQILWHCHDLKTCIFTFWKIPQSVTVSTGHHPGRHLVGEA